MAGERIIVDGSAFVDTAANWIVDAIRKVLQEREVCHLMLAGGGTPLPVYGALVKRELPWGKLKLYFGDERCVPSDHADSNYRAVTQVLFPHGIPAGVELYRMQGEQDPESAALEYEALLPERIDILLLGMGGDGHTASLFPGSSALDETARRVLPVIGPKPPPQRLTVTPPVIRAAHHVLVMAEGDGKADAVRHALELGDVPVALASGGDWVMDRGAASALSKG